MLQVVLLIDDLGKPFAVIICLFVALGVVALLSPLPEVKAAGEDSSETDEVDQEVSAYANSKKFCFPVPTLGSGCYCHLLLCWCRDYRVGNAH